MNPYQPPQHASPPSPSVPQADRDKLYTIAKCQRTINLIVLAYFGTGFASNQLGDAPGGRLIIGFVVLAVMVAGAVFAGRMANALWSTGAAVVCAILLLIPCVGLLTLLVLNSRATTRLRAAGFKVGLLGGDPEEVRRQLQL